MGKSKHYFYQNMSKEEQVQKIHNFMKEKEEKIKQGIKGGLVFALATLGLFVTPYVAIAMAISAIYSTTKFSGAIVLNGFIKELSNLNNKEKNEEVTLLYKNSKEDLEPNSSYVTLGHTNKEVNLEKIKKENENFNKMGAYEKLKIRKEKNEEKKKEQKEDIASKE